MFSIDELRLIYDIIEDYSDDNFDNVNNLKVKIYILIQKYELLEYLESKGE